MKRLKSHIKYKSLRISLTEPKDAVTLDNIKPKQQNPLFPFNFKEKSRQKRAVVIHGWCVQLFVTPWTVAGQAPLSMGFPRQEYWSGLRDNIYSEEKEGRKEGREGEEGKEEKKEGKRKEKMESHIKVY